MLEKRRHLKETIKAQSELIHNRESCILGQRDEIREYQKENKALYDENKDLRYENDELSEFKDKVTNIINSKDTIVNKYNKIKELVTTAINN